MPLVGFTQPSIVTPVVFYHFGRKVYRPPAQGRQDAETPWDDAWLRSPLPDGEAPGDGAAAPAAGRAEVG